MSKILQKIKQYLPEFSNILIILTGFIIFVDHMVSRAVLVVTLFIWLLTGDYKEKLKKVFSDKLILTFIVFIGIFFIGMLWTENFYAGRKIIERPLLYLIAPIMFTIYKPKYLKLFLWSMLLALIITGILTFLIQYGYIHMEYNSDESPFVNRVYLAGMLIFAYSYFLYKIDTNKLFSFYNLIWILLAILMVYTLIISGSRMGLINLLIATFIMLIYQYHLTLKKIIITIITISILSIVAYKSSSHIQYKVNQTINTLENMDMKAQIFNHEINRRTSLTCRFEFWYYAYSLWRQHPILGVGTGDGIDELGKLIGKKEEKQLFKQCLGDGSGQFNPHNMYLFMLMQFGVFGFIVILWILYTQLKVVLVVTTIITLFSLSELFTSKYFIPFYGFSVTLMYLFYKEKDRVKL